MKYRLLSFEELQSLDKEFKEFLLTRAVTPEEWSIIRVNNQDKAVQLIEDFSDQVFEQVLNQVDFLELRKEKQFIQVQFKDKTYKEIGITVDPKEEVDFKDPDQVQEFISNVQKSIATKFSVYKKEEAYTKSRTEEIFLYVDAGAKKSDEKTFQLMERLYNDSRAIQN